MPSQRTATHDAARSIDISTALPATRQIPGTIQEGYQRGNSTEMARKSIQGYFAMYPRINGQVSNITLQSILASFFRPDRYIRQGKPDETLDQTQPKRKRAKFYRTAKAATRHSSSKFLSSLKQSCHPHNLHAQNQTAKRKAAFTNESCLYHYSRYSKWGNSLAILSQLVDVLSQT